MQVEKFNGCFLETGILWLFFGDFQNIFTSKLINVTISYDGVCGIERMKFRKAFSWTGGNAIRAESEQILRQQKLREAID